jgi:hypothetical protein
MEKAREGERILAFGFGSTTNMAKKNGGIDVRMRGGKEENVRFE